MRYHLTVAGTMSERLVRQFDPREVQLDASTTTLLVDVRDQAALIGLVDRVGDLGLELVAMTRAQDAPDDASSSAPEPS
jgi:hypothetical protein